MPNDLRGATCAGDTYTAKKEEELAGAGDKTEAAADAAEGMKTDRE